MCSAFCFKQTTADKVATAGADTAAALLARLRALQRSKPAPAAPASPGVVDCCAICLGAVDEPATLDCCTHVFCYTCIAAWTAQTSRCPLCKRVVAVLKKGVDEFAVQPRELRVDWLGDDAALFALEEEEETPCMVCGRDDPEDAATLLLCDGPGCVGACHVACAGLYAVPERDWFCARCAPAAGAPPADALTPAELQAEPEASLTQGAAAADTSIFERFRWTQPGAR